MAIFDVTDFYPGSIPFEDKARNGKVPDWMQPSACAYRYQFALQHQRKMVFCKTTAPGAAPQSDLTQQIPWRWKCRTGENTHNANTVRFSAVATMLPSSNSSSTDPKWRLFAGANNSLYRHAPTIVSSPTLSDLITTQVSISGLTPNTEYDCGVEIEDGCRLMSLMVYEIAARGIDTAHTTAVIDHTPYGFEREITDAQHKQLHEVPYLLYRHNAAHIANIVPETEAGFWTRSLGTYANLLDQSASTTVSTHTPGINPQVRYWNPAHTDDVTCEFAVYGSNASSAGGFIKLVDANGDVSGSELSSFSTGGEWQQATIALDGSNSLHKLDVQFRGDGVNVFTPEAVSIYAYIT